MSKGVSIFSDTTAFEVAQRTAKALMTASVLPKEYTSNMGNMLIALDVASRLGMTPLEVMQQLYIVHGKPAWSSQALLGFILSSGEYTSPDYAVERDKSGKVISCTLKMIRTSDKKEVTGPVVTWVMAESEGWTKKNGSKWLTMPETMFRYRAISFFAKSMCPHITLGMQTREEIEDIGKDVTPNDEDMKTDSLKALSAKAKEQTEIVIQNLDEKESGQTEVQQELIQ